MNETADVPGLTRTARSIRRVETADRDTSTSRTGRSMPPVLLEKTASRVRIATLTYAAAYVASVSSGELVLGISGEGPIGWHAGHTIGLACALIALALCAATRSSLALSPSTLLWLGLAFEVVGSLGISLGEFSEAREIHAMVWGISWVGVWIVAYPLLVPSPPRAAAVAGILSALTTPLALGVWTMVDGRDMPSIASFTRVTTPNLICAGISWFGARAIYRLGADLSHARRVGSYELEARLGEGGMGEVWRARHRLLARPAAIKLIRPEVLSRSGDADRAHRRFRREATATAALRSPHTIELYDFGRTEDGRFYYVMELLAGPNLETLVARHGRLPAERAVWLLRQVCHSLAEASAAALVHRDIKPANIFVCHHGMDHDFVKVLDFGLVRRVGRGGPGNALDTVDSVDARISGTPGYLAPEAVTRSGDVDARADIYSLGCVAYWMLTARHVFERESALAVILAHTSDAPEPPGRVVGPGGGIPPELDRLVIRCLEKSPADRPASAAALRDELTSLPGLATWDEEAAREWWSRVARSAEPEDPAGPARDPVATI